MDYSIKDYYENGDWFYSDDLYALTLDLNDDNKFDITETYSYKDVNGDADFFDGTSVFFDFWGSEDITSLNLKTGQYNTETLFQSNLDFYLGEAENSYVDDEDLQQTDNYGLVAGIRAEDNELIFVGNIDKENHSLLFKAEFAEDYNGYIDDITENKFGTINVVTGHSKWSYSSDDNFSINTAEENYDLYTYTKNGI